MASAGGGSSSSGVTPQVEIRVALEWGDLAAGTGLGNLDLRILDPNGQLALTPCSRQAADGGVHSGNGTCSTTQLGRETATWALMTTPIAGTWTALVERQPAFCFAEGQPIPKITLAIETFTNPQVQTIEIDPALLDNAGDQVAVTFGHRNGVAPGSPAPPAVPVDVTCAPAELLVILEWSPPEADLDLRIQEPATAQFPIGSIVLAPCRRASTTGGLHISSPGSEGAIWEAGTTPVVGEYFAIVARKATASYPNGLPIDYTLTIFGQDDKEQILLGIFSDTTGTAPELAADGELAFACFEYRIPEITTPCTGAPILGEPCPPGVPLVHVPSWMDHAHGLSLAVPALKSLVEVTAVPPWLAR